MYILVVKSCKKFDYKKSYFINDLQVQQTELRTNLIDLVSAITKFCYIAPSNLRRDTVLSEHPTILAVLARAQLSDFKLPSFKTEEKKRLKIRP